MTDSQQGQTGTREAWVVLSLMQPWAAAMFTVKRIETRSWQTSYRGRLYIHASKGFGPAASIFAFDEAPRLPKLEFGCIIGHVDLIDIKPTSQVASWINPTEKMYGDYSEGRYAWITQNPVLLDKPIQAKGQLSIWRFIPPPTTGILHRADAGTFPRLGVRKDGGAE